MFFFTALYLEEVVGDSGYQIAEIFLPMTVLMVLASVLAGFWTITAGLRWSMLVGCVLFSAGLLLTSLAISPDPAYLPLAAALSLAGIGVGATVVPATSSALSSVPPERSGMAASTTNTSREIGAVTGVAVLGALVASRLESDLTSSLQHLGLSKALQQYVIPGSSRAWSPPAETPAASGRRPGRPGAEGRARRLLTRSSPACTPRCCSRRSSCWSRASSASSCSGGGPGASPGWRRRRRPVTNARDR